MKKKILIIGNGAKEYALAKKLSENHDIYVTPKSDTLKEFATCLDIRVDNVSELLEFVMESGIDMTIPIAKEALQSNIVDMFNKNRLNIFAPTVDATKIVFDKAIAKKTLYKLRIPTPKFGVFEKQNAALDYIKNQKKPFVMKTNDSNSAVVLTSVNMAKSLIESSFMSKNQQVVIEDYIYGTPFQFYTVTDGYKALPFGSSILYKHSLEGDGGQLTSGMGACSPNYKLTIEQEYFIMDNVIYPTLDYLEIEQQPYLGILGVNGIITEDGKIYVLGWQSFMQDCDSAAVLDMIDDDLYSIFESCILGSFSDDVVRINQKEQFATSLVLTCKNLQNDENPIAGLDNIDENTIITFYPATIKNKYLEYEAKSGPVLIITSSASTVGTALDKMYCEAGEISFKSLNYRKDICSYSCLKS